GFVVAQTRSTTAFVQSELLPQADPPLVGPWPGDAQLKRQPGMLKPVEGSNLEIVGGQQIAAGQPVSIFAKRARLKVTSGAAGGLCPRDGPGPWRLLTDKSFWPMPIRRKARNGAWSPLTGFPALSPRQRAT